MTDSEDVYVTPGHPVAAGAGYNCGCGQCRACRAWIANGFTLEQASAWTAVGFTTPTAAQEWTQIGIDDPVVAEQWSEAGFTAKTAHGWIAIEDITPSEAATCANGYLKPADVERIRRADPTRALTETQLARSQASTDLGIDV